MTSLPIPSERDSSTPDLGDSLPIDSDIEVDEARNRRPRPLHLQWRSVGLVAIGGTIGTAIRELISLIVPSLGVFPLPIFGINIIGAFSLGALLESLVRRGPDEGRRRTLRLLLGTGVLGGFTTYSTLATGASELLTTDHALIAVGYAIGTVIVGAGATFSGIALSAAHHRRLAAKRRAGATR